MLLKPDKIMRLKDKNMNDLLFSVFPNENFVDIGLYQYGWEHCTPAHSFGPAARNHYIFHYVISGTGTLMADNSAGETITYQVKSGQGFMLFPGQINTYIADTDFPWEYTWVEFDGLRAKEIVEELSDEDITTRVSEIASREKEQKKKQKTKKYDEVDMAQMSLFDTVKDDDVLEELKSIDVGNLTPVDALNTIYRLQNKLKNRW